MKVLLLHPEGGLAEACAVQHWDLVVDIGRAPVAIYDRRIRQARCPVVSIYDYAEEIEDLHRLRELLQLGTGRMVDQWGIDWWDVLSLEIVPQLQQLLLVRRLSKELDASCELYASRPHPLASALERLLGVRLTVLDNPFHAVIHRARHYRDAFSHLDTAQLAQVLVDKFDNVHSIRRRFARRGHSSGKPVILLPSAYVNVSRAAFSYAELLPDHQFLLVRARNNAKVPTLPPNVRSAALTPYFVANDKLETDFLLESWNGLRKHLARSTDVFNMADAVGLLGRIPALLRWGLALRDAWSQVFESENVTACLCGDDSNPPSSIPLIMAKKRGLPALACHHGALNYMMAIKMNHADFYLVKSEMERDYLRRICNLAPEKIVIAAPLSSKPLPWRRRARSSAPWLVFFTEPYQSCGWRREEVYRDLLPRLCSLARATALKLVFKLHPFESVKGHRRMLRRLIPEQERQIEIIAGPPTSQLWSNTRFAITVQSSTAVECAALDIPVFLCAWLRDPFSGYVPQFARFGVGRVLESPEQIADIPRLLEEEGKNPFQMGATGRTRECEPLTDLLSGAYSFPMASNG
jgi:hypothetical protein